MKTLILGAAGLLLSSSALAAMPQTKGMVRPASPAVASKQIDGLGGSMIGNAITIDWPAKAADAGKWADAGKSGDPTKLIDAGAKPEAAAAEIPSTAALSEAGKGIETMTGMGGPEEPVEAPAVRAVSANDYPPCTSRADDNCIQLYEPGVRESLAAFQASHDMNQTGMGGPEEAADDSAADKTSPETAAYEPLPEDAVMPATEDMAALPTKGPDTPAAI